MFSSFNLFIVSTLFATSALAASHHPQEFLKRIEGTKNEGEQIVQHFCASCHASKPMIELGAPKMGQSLDWEPRFKQGMQALLTHTEEGINAMPARGGCFECSDQQLSLALLFLLPEHLHNLALIELKDHKKSK